MLALPPASAQQSPARVTETVLELSDGSVLRYAVSLPEGYDAGDMGARPLVIALHPGGRAEYYGSSFMQGVIEPALRAWGAVIVAPDVPDRSWATPRSERALLALVERIRGEHAIDPRRLLVTGYSMGGRGAWYMAARHPETFTGAIVMAGSPGDDWVAMSAIPLYLIHSPHDEVVDFEPVERAYLQLAGRGHPIEMTVLPGIGHYSMGAYGPALRVAGNWMLSRWREP